MFVKCWDYDSKETHFLETSDVAFELLPICRKRMTSFSRRLLDIQIQVDIHIVYTDSIPLDFQGIFQNFVTLVFRNSVNVFAPLPKEKHL